MAHGPSFFGPVSMAAEPGLDAELPRRERSLQWSPAPIAQVQRPSPSMSSRVIVDAMSESHEIWIAHAGGTGDLHHRNGQIQVSSERMAQELSQLAQGLSNVLDRVHEGSSGYRLHQVTIDVTFDSEVGFALVGSRGATRTMTLTFVRTRPS